MELKISSDAAAALFHLMDYLKAHDGNEVAVQLKFNLDTCALEQVVPFLGESGNYLRGTVTTPEGRKPYIEGCEILGRNNKPWEETQEGQLPPVTIEASHSDGDQSRGNGDIPENLQ